MHKANFDKAQMLTDTAQSYGSWRLTDTAQSYGSWMFRFRVQFPEEELGDATVSASIMVP